MINQSRDQEGIVLCQTKQDSLVRHAEFLCQVYIGRWRKPKLVNYRLRKVETSGRYRMANTDSVDGASSTGKFMDIASSSTPTSSTPRSDYIQPFRAFSGATSEASPQIPSQTLSQTASQASRPPFRVLAPEPSRAESNDKIRAFAERHNVLNTIDTQRWVIT